MMVRRRPLQLVQGKQVHLKRVHLIGIGGIGVSALARYFLSQGWQVSGSDLPKPLLSELLDEGVNIQLDHRGTNLRLDTDLVVYSQAIPHQNSELKKARRLKIRTLSYPQALGSLTKGFNTVAIAGTHGKSTATALTALALIEAGFDPTVIVGTNVPQFGPPAGGKNFRLGGSKYLVIEADEYKDAFLHYYPQAILITNIDREHLDYFKDLNHIKKSFLKFISNLEKDGILVLNKDSNPLLFLAKKTKHKIIWYTLKEKKLVKKIKKTLKIPGEHNLSNALGVYKLARALGAKEKEILRAFSKYRGSWRRMEYKGKFQIPKLKLQIPIYDDYAHHPTEIKATLNAFREKFPRSAGWRIICVFQPHQAERLKRLFREFTSAFDQADALILLDIFKVRGRERQGASDKRQAVNSKKLAEAIQKRKGGPERVIYLPYPSRLKQTLQPIIKDKSVIVMMGAGDIVELTPRLLK